MIKKEAMNAFSGGLDMDKHPMILDNKTYTYALNGTLSTNNGNEGLMQNDLGNTLVGTVKLPDGYTPIGTCEFGGIIYIVAHNPVTKRSQIGSFPSPKRLNSSDNSTGLVTSFSLDLLLDTLTADNQYGLKAGSLAIKETTKIITITDNYLFPGDKYIIYKKTGDLGDYISYYSSEEKNLLTIKPIGISEQGNILDLISTHTYNSYSGPKTDENGNIVKDSENKVVSVSRKDYFIYEGNATEEGQTAEDLQAMADSPFNIYSAKEKGKIGLQFVLNVPDSFTCTYKLMENEKNPGHYYIQFQVYAADYLTAVSINGTDYELTADKLDKSGLFYRINIPTGNNYYTKNSDATQVVSYKIVPKLKEFYWTDKYVKYDVDWNKVNSGIYEIPFYKYYKTDTTIEMKFTTSLYPFLNQEISKIKLDFYDFYGYTGTYTISDLESYSGTYDFTIPFGDENGSIPEFDFEYDDDDEFKIPHHTNITVSSTWVKGGIYDIDFTSIKSNANNFSSTNPEISAEVIEGLEESDNTLLEDPDNTSTSDSEQIVQEDTPVDDQLVPDDDKLVPDDDQSGVETGDSSDAMEDDGTLVDNTPNTDSSDNTKVTHVCRRYQFNGTEFICIDPNVTDETLQTISLDDIGKYTVYEDTSGILNANDIYLIRFKFYTLPEGTPESDENLGTCTKVIDKILWTTGDNNDYFYNSNISMDISEQDDFDNYPIYPEYTTTVTINTNIDQGRERESIDDDTEEISLQITNSYNCTHVFTTLFTNPTFSTSSEKSWEYMIWETSPVSDLPTSYELVNTNGDTVTSVTLSKPIYNSDLFYYDNGHKFKWISTGNSDFTYTKDDGETITLDTEYHIEDTEFTLKLNLTSKEYHKFVKSSSTKLVYHLATASKSDCTNKYNILVNQDHFSFQYVLSFNAQDWIKNGSQTIIAWAISDPEKDYRTLTVAGDDVYKTSGTYYYKNGSYYSNKSSVYDYSITGPADAYYITSINPNAELERYSSISRTASWVKGFCLIYPTKHSEVLNEHTDYDKYGDSGWNEMRYCVVPNGQDFNKDPGPNDLKYQWRKGNYFRSIGPSWQGTVYAIIGMKGACGIHMTNTFVEITDLDFTRYDIAAKLISCILNVYTVISTQQELNILTVYYNNNVPLLTYTLAITTNMRTNATILVNDNYITEIKALFETFSGSSLTKKSFDISVKPSNTLFSYEFEYPKINRNFEEIDYNCIIELPDDKKYIKSDSSLKSNTMYGYDHSTSSIYEITDGTTLSNAMLYTVSGNMITSTGTTFDIENFGHMYKYDTSSKQLIMRLEYNKSEESTWAYISNVNYDQASGGWRDNFDSERLLGIQYDYSH